MPEIIDPIPVPVPLRNPLIGQRELEILAGRRAFAVAQELFAGSPVEPSVRVSAGWHDSSVNPETGSFAVVGIGAGLDYLIGEIVLVSYQRRSVFVYVLASADVPVQLSLSRRPFAALSVLTVEQITAMVAASE